MPANMRMNVKGPGTQSDVGHYTGGPLQVMRGTLDSIISIRLCGASRERAC